VQRGGGAVAGWLDGERCEKTTGRIALGAAAISFFLALALLYLRSTNQIPEQMELGTWLTSGAYRIALNFRADAPGLALSLVGSYFSLLVAHVCVPPALQALLSTPDNRMQGLLAAGHVCAVMGYWEYQPIVESFHVPIVVTGFEPVDILRGVLACVEELERGEATVVNAYARAVTREGNVPAQQLLKEVFEPVDLAWRGLGTIPLSGLGLAPSYRRFDAAERFETAGLVSSESALCRSGEVLTGRLDPRQCPAFGKECTPDTPLGATMVSSEGACAAYYRYRHGQ